MHEARYLQIISYKTKPASPHEVVTFPLQPSQLIDPQAEHALAGAFPSHSET